MDVNQHEWLVDLGRNAWLLNSMGLFRWCFSKDWISEAIGSDRRVHWGRDPMKRRAIRVRIFRGEKMYVAECMDLPIITEGETLDEGTANTRRPVGLHLEGDNLAEMDLAPNPATVAYNRSPPNNLNPRLALPAGPAYSWREIVSDAVGFRGYDKY